MEKNYTFDDLVEIIAKLRGENGCPWDKAQTHESLTKYLIEESYEYIEATKNKEPEKQADELGDVLLQVVLNSRIGEEKGEFTINDVINNISKKMIYRHPHVFSDTKVTSVNEVLDNWEELKKKEQNIKSDKEVLLSVSKSLPALIRAEKVIKKIKKLKKTEKFQSFNKESIDKINKLLDNKVVQVDKSHKNENLGDLFMALIYVAVNNDISVEMCLNDKVDELIERFN